jgi:DNA-binding response OmpR family regulator
VVVRGKCLIIEDDRDIAELLKDILTQAGFEIHLEGTGTGALVAVAREEYALITLDLGLPDIEGAQLAPLLRASSPAPILVITARTTTNPDGWTTDPAEGHLSKPFIPSELRNIIDRLLPEGR